MATVSAVVSANLDLLRQGTDLIRRPPDAVLRRDPAPSAWSVCRHRDDARTVSHAEIEVGAAGAVLRYLDGPPCSLAPALELRLALAPAAA